MTSRISVNIHGQSVRDKNKLLAWLTVLQPRAVLVLDDLSLARTIKTAIPTCTVIFREYEGGKDITQVDPTSWLDAHAHQADGGLTLNVGNELPFSAVTLAWLKKVCERAVRAKIPLVIGNLAVGNPEPDQWKLMKDLLQILDQNRDLFALGLHEYAVGVITSGLMGGIPMMIMPGQWPAIVPFTRWHCGRFQFLIDYCQSINLRPPRMFITEHGFDNVDASLDTWRRGLKHTAPYADIRGWKSLAEQWKIWYGGMGWSAERAYAEQLIWADTALYGTPGSPVEAQMVFCYGHSSEDWNEFDVEDAREWQDLLVKHAQEATPPVTAPLPNDPRWTLSENVSGDNYRVRWQPQIDDREPLAMIDAGSRFYHVPGLAVNAFIPVKTTDGLIGYTSADILKIAPPASPPDVEPVTDIVAIFKSHRDMFALLIADTEKARDELAVQVDELAARIEALRNEKHALDNKVAVIDEKIGMYRELLKDYDVIEKAVKAA